MQDTIAAIATGRVVSAIGIIRVSGSQAISAADKIFRAANRVRLADAEARRMYYGELAGDSGELIDLCLCMVSHAPDSYTGEDTVEFHCHGSPVVLSEVLRVLSVHGVRQAQAGEFTKRAFLNGRMDLTQAEAVIDIIEAETLLAARNAAGQLGGAVGKKLEAVYSSLIGIMAHFHAVIDYPDEDIDDFRMQGYLAELKDAGEKLARLAKTHERGRILRDGIPAVIVGRPNTGKSSLLNALLGYERAIVTDIPGTTRDTIEEKALICGVLLRLIDTAGIRKTEETVEKHGVARTMTAMGDAGLIIMVLDGSEEMREDDFALMHSIPEGVPRIAAINKSDLPLAINPQLTIRDSQSPCCFVSALTGEGLEDLEAEIKRLFPEPEGQSAGEVITNARQFDAISRAGAGIAGAIASIEAAVTPDAVLTEVEAALSAIGEITGKNMREDIIEHIFNRFCVGK